MKPRRLILLLFTLALILTSCGQNSNKGYEPPEWLSGFNFSAETERVLQLVIENGADDASLAELKTLSEHAAELPYYYFSAAYTGPDRAPLTDHARTAVQFFEMMLGTQKNAWNWADVSAQTDIYLTALRETEAPTADMRWLPLFESRPESDPLHAVLACFFRAKYAKEQTNEIVSVTFGGDTSFGQRAGADAKLSFDTEFSRHDGDLSFPFRLMPVYLRNDSLTVLNCATAFTNGTEARSENALRGSPGYAGMFSAGDVEAVNIANEFTASYFDVGYRDTQKNLTNAGVTFFGGSDICVLEADGVKFGFLGYDLTQDIPNLEARLKTDIASARSQGAQLVFTSLYWGSAGTEALSEKQISTAHLAVDLGADAVIGYHPRTLQAMEVYKDKVIAYSLGSFVRGSESTLSDNGYGALLRLTYQKNKDGTLTALTPTLLPVYVSSSSEGASANNYTPYPALGDISDHITRLIFKLSRPLEFGIKELAAIA